MVKTIGAKWLIHCIELVCFSEGPLLEVLLYLGAIPVTYIYVSKNAKCASKNLKWNDFLDCRRWLSTVHTQRYRGHQSEEERETCTGRKGGWITKGLAYVHLKVLAQHIFAMRLERKGEVHTGVSLTGDVTGWGQTYTLVNMSENQSSMDFSNDFWHSNTTKLDTV